MLERNEALIRRPILAGHQQIEGLWFSSERFDESARERLILEHWQVGAGAYRFAEGDLLRFCTALSVQCETLAGWPLIRQGAGLCSALLAPEELHTLPAADVWLVRGSQVQALLLRDAEGLSPGQWLNISGYTLLDTYDCNATLAEPVFEARVTDVRTIIGGPLGSVSPEREGVMQALIDRQRAAPKQPAASASAPGKNPWKPAEPVSFPALKLGATFALVGALIWMASYGKQQAFSPLPPPVREDFSGVILGTLVGAIVFTALLMGLNKFLRRGSPGVAAPPPAKAAQGIAPRATPVGHKPAAWRRWLTRLTQHSKLSALYGKRQAAYMQRMLEMFEDGDFAEALRHAIPLGGEQGSSEQMFGTPERRQDLRLSEQSGPRRAMLFEEGLEAHLRQIYRQTFTRLDREGRIEEAVFVLAELLKVRQEALDYLEKHGRYQQAADLALAWDMPAAVIVRLLCLAEQWEQALSVARRDNAFGEAVLALQAKSPESANRLRLEWAQSLTEKGLWLQAVDVIWSLPAERGRAAQWLLNAEAAGGRLAIDALVKRAILLPETLHAYGPWVEQLRNDPQRGRERAALAQALLAHKAEAGALAWLTGATVHAIVADQLSGEGGLTHHQLQALVKMSKDKLLLTDLPGQALKRSAVVPLSQAGKTQEWWVPARGNRGIHDAVALEDSRYLLALGEAGAVVIDEFGNTLFHFAVPAQEVVLAHGRQVALVLIRRNDAWRISKLDLVNRTATDLGVLVVDVFAKVFDGTAWSIGREKQMRVVDVDRGFATLWHVSDLPGRVYRLQSDECNEYLWLFSVPGVGIERWHYRLPERRLMGREVVPAINPDHNQLLCAVSMITECWIKDLYAEELILVVNVAGNHRGYRLPGASAELIEEYPVSVHLEPEWLLFRYALAENQSRWHMIHRASDRLCATWTWPLDDANVRQQGDDWLLFDEQGRLSHINVANGSQRNITLN
jgi:hypothetical protein